MSKMIRRLLLSIVIASPAVAMFGCGETKPEPVTNTPAPAPKNDPGPATAAPQPK